MPGSNPSENEKMLRGRKKTATTLLRIVLGVLFVFSALVKLNDPMGLAFKIQEYLSLWASGLHLSPSLAIDAAGTLITLELILGVVLLLGRFKVFALWTLLALNGLFTLVTFYSAVTGAVPHCGCFGDALVLSPWVSFIKSLVTLALTVTLLLWQRFIKPSVGFRTSMSVVALLFAFSIGMIYYVLRHEPPIDFRPYKVGTNLAQALSAPADQDPTVSYNVWIYRVDGQEKQYRDSDEPWNIPGAEFVSRKTLRTGGIRPNNTADFMVFDSEGNQMTDSLLAMEHVLLVTCYDMEKSEAESWLALAELQKKEILPPMVVLADTDPQTLRERFGITAPVYLADPTLLKTLLRSNPGAVELRRGTITDKWSTARIADLAQD